mmetsp:Transcript_29320/g.75280  ORF Transcript_29320/g.75280 Transcript_29320/m.75280 type:complete len:214 (+) Transcript_29320:244-885(+)
MRHNSTTPRWPPRPCRATSTRRPRTSTTAAAVTRTSPPRASRPSPSSSLRILCGVTSPCTRSCARFLRTAAWSASDSWSSGSRAAGWPSQNGWPRRWTPAPRRCTSATWTATSTAPRSARAPTPPACAASATSATPTTASRRPPSPRAPSGCLIRSSDRRAASMREPITLDAAPVLRGRMNAITHGRSQAGPTPPRRQGGLPHHGITPNPPLP